MILLLGGATGGVHLNGETHPVRSDYSNDACEWSVMITPSAR